MNITYRTYQQEDITLLQDLWNDILVEGIAFPGTIPQGFRLKSGEYSDMHIMYLAFS